MSSRATIAAMMLSLAVGCGATSGTDPTFPPDSPEGPLNGKADGPGTPTIFEGVCAADAPSVPYEPVPQGTRAQPEGPEVLHTRVGVPLGVEYDRATSLRGEFRSGDCGRHYFVFTLDRAATLSIGGVSLVGSEPAGLDLCFVRPRFLRIDTPWYTDIWEKESYVDSAPPCGTFVPVGDRFEPSSGGAMELTPGSYELTIEPQMGNAAYDLQLAFDPIGSAVCGDGVRDAGEGCDDGNQLPLDWCGADCRPQRLDLEPIQNNETTDTAQPLDGFRVLNFYAPVGDKEVDVYSLELAAGELVELGRGERACRDTVVQLYGGDGVPIAEPWNCESMASTDSFTASRDGRYYLRFETAPQGARSVTARILP